MKKLEAQGWGLVYCKLSRWLSVRPGLGALLGCLFTSELNEGGGFCRFLPAEAHSGYICWSCGCSREGCGEGEREGGKDHPPSAGAAIGSFAVAPKRRCTLGVGGGRGRGRAGISLPWSSASKLGPASESPGAWGATKCWAH